MKHEHGGNIYKTGYELDFSANINPLGIPQRVLEAALEGVRRSIAYPDPDQTALRREIARRDGVDIRQVICGNGAAELIFLLCDAKKPAKALLLSPGFAEYEAALCKAGSEIVYYPCREEDAFAVKEDYLDCLTDDLDMLFLCVPNNPTGHMISRELLEKILAVCDRKDILMVVDECFIGLTDEGDALSMAGDLERSANLFILRAFTKLYGMAGLRLGYGLCADERLLERMRGACQPWNVSIPAQMAGTAALRELDFEERSRALIGKQRAFLVEGLKRLGLTVYPPGANFIFFRGPLDLGEKCAGKGILIRDCSNYRGLEKGYWRIAVRTREENRRLLAVFEEVLWQSRL